VTGDSKEGKCKLRGFVRKSTSQVEKKKGRCFHRPPLSATTYGKEPPLRDQRGQVGRILTARTPSGVPRRPRHLRKREEEKGVENRLSIKNERGGTGEIKKVRGVVGAYLAPRISPLAD